MRLKLHTTNEFNPLKNRLFIKLISLLKLKTSNNKFDIDNAVKVTFFAHFKPNLTLNKLTCCCRCLESAYFHKRYKREIQNNLRRFNVKIKTEEILMLEAKTNANIQFP